MATLDIIVKPKLKFSLKKCDEVVPYGITPEEREKLAGIEENANNYTHPEKHPSSILDVVDVVNGAANKFLNERGEMVAVAHESVTDKNSEADFQHVDTTTTKPTLDVADMVAVKDSVTGKMVLTSKNNLQTTVTQSTGTSETDVMSQKSVTDELAAKEVKANKQNSLAVDGTGTKFPTVDAVNEGLNLKSDKLPFSTYIHSGNKEVYISSVDVDTNTFTSVSHGLVNTNEVYIAFQDNLSNLIAGSVMPGGMTTKPTGSFYVINKTNDTFQLSLTSGGVAIDLTTNANMDLSKWHFEKIIDTVNITGIPASTKMIRAILSGRNVQPSVTGIGLIRINEMPSDTKWYSGTGFFYPINDCYGTIYHYLVVEIDTNMLLKVSVSGFRISHNTISANTNEIINKSSIYSDISYKNVDISKVAFTNIRLANGAKIELYTL